MLPGARAKAYLERARFMPCFQVGMAPCQKELGLRWIWGLFPLESHPPPQCFLILDKTEKTLIFL